MVNGVVRLAGVRRNERNAHRVGDRLQFIGRRRGQADELRVEVAQVLLELLGRIAVRVDADQHNLQFIHSLGWQFALDLPQLGEGGRADVRAEGVAEEQQAPLAFQFIDRDRLAVLIGHRHVRQITALRQQDDAGVDQRRRIALVFPGQHLVDGQAQDQCDQGDEYEDGFLGSSHRFNSK
ncbi:hypothetical protein D3C85_1351200 [compost metagenome]